MLDFGHGTAHESVMETTKQETEAWESFPGCQLDYEVSNLGRVRSIGAHSEPRILKPSVTKTGALQVMLSFGGKPKTKQVHRLVAEAFIPNIHDCKYVQHDNDDKWDNRVSNLYWSDLHDPSFRSLRKIHSIRTTPGTVAEVAKLFGMTEDQVTAIRAVKTS